MAESLWSAIDTHLKNELNDFMGSESGFTTDKLALVEATILQNPQSWAKKELPFAVVDGRLSNSRDLEHGDVYTNTLQERLRYFIACVVRDNAEDATARVKTLDSRVLLFLQDQMNKIQLVVDDNGSHPTELIPGNAAISLYPIVGANNEYYAYSMRAFDVIAHMEG